MYHFNSYQRLITKELLKTVFDLYHLHVQSLAKSDHPVKKSDTIIDICVKISSNKVVSERNKDTGHYKNSDFEMLQRENVKLHSLCQFIELSKLQIKKS